MSLLNLFAAARTAATAPTKATAARRAQLARRPAIDCLEKREVFTAGIAQAGTTMGLAWRFAPDGSANGGGTLYVQDVAQNTNASDRTNAPIAINQSNGHMTFDTDDRQTFNGPAVANSARVKIVLGATLGDINVYDDRSGGGGLSQIDRHQTGRITMGQNSVNWTLDENVVTQQAVVNLQSNAGSYNINRTGTYDSPGDPNYVVNSQLKAGLQVTDQNEGSGGVSVDPGMQLTVHTSGGATFKTNKS